MKDAKDAPPLPDRLSVDPISPHYVAAVVEHDIGIGFNDRERFDVQEYCLSEGWVKVPAGRTVDRKGKPVMIKLTGRVEAFLPIAVRPRSATPRARQAALTNPATPPPCASERAGGCTSCARPRSS